MSAGKSKKTLAVGMVSALLAVAAGNAAAADTGAATSADTGLTAGDRDFINKAAQGNLMEVAAGKLAEERALNPTVKDFGRRLVADHGANKDTLKALADSKQMNLPDTVSPEGHETLGKLEGLNGTEFDKAFSKMMVKDHTTDISDFEKEVKKAKDPDVKAYAEQTLPTLRHHLMLANRLSAAEKKSP